MATRLYLSAVNDVPGGLAPAFNGSWTYTNGGRRAMTPTKDGTALTDFPVFIGDPESASVTDMAAQFVSPPLAAGIAFSTSDTVRGVVRCIESNADDNIAQVVALLKVVSFLGALRATLLSLSAYGPFTFIEFDAASLASRYFFDGDTLASGYTTIARDRLVLEIGAQVSGAGGTSVQGQLNFGSPAGGNDLNDTENETTASAPWLEISRDLTFLVLDDDSRFAIMTKQNWDAGVPIW